jgi:hypothetical protein
LLRYQKLTYCEVEGSGDGEHDNKMAAGEKSYAARKYKDDRIQEQEDDQEEALHRKNSQQILFNKIK